MACMPHSYISRCLNEMTMFTSVVFEFGTSCTPLPNPPLCHTDRAGGRRQQCRDTLAFSVYAGNLAWELTSPMAKCPLPLTCLAPIINFLMLLLLSQSPQIPILGSCQRIASLMPNPGLELPWFLHALGSYEKTREFQGAYLFGAILYFLLFSCLTFSIL
jgi:hypothetical protein